MLSEICLLKILLKDRNNLYCQPLFLCTCVAASHFSLKPYNTADFCFEKNFNQFRWKHLQIFTSDLSLPLFTILLHYTMNSSFIKLKIKKLLQKFKKFILISETCVDHFKVNIFLWQIHNFWFSAVLIINNMFSKTFGNHCRLVVLAFRKVNAMQNNKNKFLFTYL